MKTILYIDNSESYRFLLQEELSEEGFEVVAASSMEEALSKWPRINPDFVILELRQKILDVKSFEKLRKRYPGIPCIGHSTYSECPSEYKEWVDYYLPKLPQSDGLKELIKSL